MAFILVWQALLLGAIYIGIGKKKKDEQGMPAWFMLVNAVYFLIVAIITFLPENIVVWVYPFCVPVLLCQLPVFHWFVLSADRYDLKDVPKQRVDILPAAIILVFQISILFLPETLPLSLTGKVKVPDHDTLLRIFFTWTSNVSFYILFPFQFVYYTLLYRRNLLDIVSIDQDSATFFLDPAFIRVRPFLIGITVFFLVNEISYVCCGINELDSTFFVIGMLCVNLFIGFSGLWLKRRPEEPEAKSIAYPEIENERSEEIMDTEFSPDTDQTNHKRSSISPEKRKVIIGDLNRLMQKEELFTDAKLNMEAVAKRLKVHTKYLSQSINEEYNYNFYNYLNLLRVEKAKTYLVAEPHAHFSIEGIANLVGFQSRSSFYTAFKRITGLTPLEYRVKMREGGSYEL